MYCCLDLSHGLVRDVTSGVMTTSDSTCKKDPSEDKEATVTTNLSGGRNLASVWNVPCQSIKEEEKYEEYKELCIKH